VFAVSSSSQIHICVGHSSLSQFAVPSQKQKAGAEIKSRTIYSEKKRQVQKQKPHPIKKATGKQQKPHCYFVL
jgi:hypothetical protein